jgi:hypothetical protein
VNAPFWHLIVEWLVMMFCRVCFSLLMLFLVLPIGIMGCIFIVGSHPKEAFKMVGCTLKATWTTPQKEQDYESADYRAWKKANQNR